MEFTVNNRSETTHYRSITITDHEPIECGGWSNKGKRFIPKRVVCAWKDGKKPYKVSVSGPVIKKNGEEGLATHREYWSIAKGRGVSDVETPQWVQDLFPEAQEEKS